MQRISTPSRFPDKFGPGKDGFRDGNTGTGEQSTQLEANWFDNAQEEIANAIELAGIPLDPTDMTQLWQAINAVATGATAGYVLKAGDTMTGALYTPTLLPCFPAAASCQISANVDNIFFTMDPGFFWSYARGGASGGTLSWISGAGSIGLGQNGILSTTGNVFIGGGTVNITSATARVALGTDMTASLICEGGSTALICDGRPGFYSQFSYSSITQRFGFVSPSFPGGGGPTAWEMDWSGNTHQQGNANIAGQFIGTITDPYAGIAIATTEAVKGVAGPWIGGSDARIKQNIVPYSRGLAAVLQLNPVEYSFIPETGLDSTRRHVGIIGQDVQPIMPEMITASSTKIGSLMFNDLLIYNPNALLYALVNAVQELATLVQELKGSATAHA